MSMWTATFVDWSGRIWPKGKANRRTLRQPRHLWPCAGNTPPAWMSPLLRCWRGSSSQASRDGVVAGTRRPMPVRICLYRYVSKLGVCAECSGEVGAMDGLGNFYKLMSEHLVCCLSFSWGVWLGVKGLLTFLSQPLPLMPWHARSFAGFCTFPSKNNAVFVERASHSLLPSSRSSFTATLWAGSELPLPPKHV